MVGGGRGGGSISKTMNTLSTWSVHCASPSRSNRRYSINATTGIYVALLYFTNKFKQLSNKKKPNKKCM